MVEEETKCWICLCSGDECPPMGSLNDAHDWVHPCRCSLVAHRKCLLEWVSRNHLDYKNEVLNNFSNEGLNIWFESINISDAYSWLHLAAGNLQPLSWFGVRNLRSDAFPNELRSFDPIEISQVFLGEIDESVVRNVAEAMAAGAREVSFAEDLSLRKSRKLVINTVCPQCNAPILLKTSRGIIVPTSVLISKTLNWFSKTITQTTILGTVGGSLLFSFGGLLTSWGLRILTTLAPESTLLKLLDLQTASSLYQAFQKNQIGIRQIMLLGLAPIYLLSFRFENRFMSWPKRLYPLLFLKPGEALGMNVKRFLLLQYPASVLNDSFKALVYNPIYFSWVHRVKPYFVCDRMSLQQLKLYEAEQQYLETQRDLEERNHNSQGILAKMLNPFRSGTEEPIAQGISARRLTMLTRFDYSQALIETTFWEKIGSTILWPAAGKLIHDAVLSKSAWFKSFLSQCTSTPNDGLYLGNLIGCCAVVLLKDLVHFFITWRRVRQLESMEVMEYMSTEWEYILNRKIGQILNHLTALGEDEESQSILNEHVNSMLAGPYRDQWVDISANIPTLAGKVNFFRYLAMKMGIERSAAFRKTKTGIMSHLGHR
ncbi:LAME_0B05446g1_1 [Lachancea meyersii CBS 8951]|uniref:LAME_0B05446g1_1 n=1 Tax=Lachancea meyersii CBS 8951 TaxID=1266667 RepID=A0A1G4IVN7_9SACH|nr:LAME_0B05446g1_1 [Lachancea meyersii CBS 8951]